MVCDLRISVHTNVLLEATSFFPLVVEQTGIGGFRDLCLTACPQTTLPELRLIKMLKLTSFKSKFLHFYLSVIFHGRNFQPVVSS